MSLSFCVHWLCFIFLLPLGAILASPGPGVADRTEPSTACASKADARTAAHLPGGFADPNIDAVYYSLDLTLDPFAGVLHGSVTMDARVLVAPLERVLLDLAPPMIVDSVFLDGTAVPFIRYAEGLEIPLSIARAEGTQLTTRVVYRGTPRITGFGSFIFGARGEIPWVWSLSQPYGARDWWPCKDDPK